jgi:hypothetical protein
VLALFYKYSVINLILSLRHLVKVLTD